MPQDPVLTQARALGEALAGHPLARAYHEAQQAVQTDASAQQLLREYQDHLARLRQLEEEQKPIEVADKQKLRDLETRVAAHEALKRVMRTQADYMALLNQVNREIEAPIDSAPAPHGPPARPEARPPDSAAERPA